MLLLKLKATNPISVCLNLQLKQAFEKSELDKTDTEAVTWRCSVKNASLNISQNSQESTCSRVSF